MLKLYGGFRHQITPACTLPFNFCPSHWRIQCQLKNSPNNCLKLCRSLKDWRPRVCTESSLRSHTRVFRQLFGAVFSQPRGNKKCWRSCACSVVCCHLSLLLQTALWWITNLPWRAPSMHKTPLKTCKLYPGTGTRRSQMQSLINVKAVPVGRG